MKLSSIYSFYLSHNKWKKQLIFGQRTKGIPGIEIIGLKSQARLIQEKILFLTRYLGYKIPLGRYSLCVDLDSFDSKTNYRDFEIAFSFLYWELAGLIPIKNIQNCCIWGRVNPPNSIEQVIAEDHLESFSENKIIRLKDSPIALDQIINDSRINFNQIEKNNQFNLISNG